MSQTKWMTILGVIALVSTIYLVIGVRSGEELFIDEVPEAIVLAIFPESSHLILWGRYCTRGYTRNCNCCNPHVDLALVQKAGLSWYGYFASIRWIWK